MSTVGWYAHHHGAGHRTRARVVGAELVTRGTAFTVLGSHLDTQALRAEGLGCLELPLDYPLAPEATPEDVDAQVGGLLHWAPLGHPGLRARMARIAAWLEAERPDVLVVDVSTEVALLARLLGIPVVLVAQPGDRRDEAHTTALRCATAVVAPWPGWATTALWRTVVPTEQLDLCAVGGVARKAAGPENPGPDGAGPHGTRWTGTERPYGLVLAGSEGFDDPGVPEQLRAAVPDLDWVVLDGRAWVRDVRPLIASSAVVVAHAGQNAVADVARHARPAVLAPQRRPFAEQEHLACALDQEGLVVLGGPAQVQEHGWAALVARARAGGGSGWARWQCDGAAGRVADVIERVGRG